MGFPSHRIAAEERLECPKHQAAVEQELECPKHQAVAELEVGLPRLQAVVVNPSCQLVAVVPMYYCQHPLCPLDSNLPVSLAVVLDAALGQLDSIFPVVRFDGDGIGGIIEVVFFQIGVVVDRQGSEAPIE